jgi:hypothetical protein
VRGLEAPLAGETSGHHCPGLTLAWSLVLPLVGRLVWPGGNARLRACGCARLHLRKRAYAPNL